MLALVKLVAGLVAGPLFDYLKTVKAAELSRETLAAEVEKAMLASGERIAAEAARVVTAEIQGDSWLQRNWRPIVALVSFGSCWFVIFPYGFLVAWGWLPQVRFGEQGLQYFFTLTTICVGGYIGGRTIEKVFRR